MSKIKEIRKWNAGNVHTTCLLNRLYTKGSAAECEEMLNMVRNTAPTPENIYRVAKDIADHSNTTRTISSIMNLLMKEAVSITFALDGNEDF